MEEPNFNPTDYPGVDPDFLHDPSIPREQWIKRMLRKLPLARLPLALRPKPVEDVVGWQPPLFLFGVRMSTGRAFWEVARRVGVLRLLDPAFAKDGDREEEDVGDEEVDKMDMQATLANLEDKIFDALGVVCKPELSLVLSPPTNSSSSVVYSNVEYAECDKEFESGSNMGQGEEEDEEEIVLHFLTSYDVEFPCSPEEVDVGVRGVLGMGESERFSWFVSAEKCVWSVGPIYEREE